MLGRDRNAGTPISASSGREALVVSPPCSTLNSNHEVEKPSEQGPSHLLDQCRANLGLRLTPPHTHILPKPPQRSHPLGSWVLLGKMRPQNILPHTLPVSTENRQKN